MKKLIAAVLLSLTLYFPSSCLAQASLSAVYHGWYQPTPLAIVEQQQIKSIVVVEPTRYLRIGRTYIRIDRPRLISFERVY